MSEGISLGWNCYSASWAVNAGIRNTRENGYLTCPFDEMLSNYEGVVNCIENDFEGFTDPNYLELKDIPSSSKYCSGDTLVYNRKYKFLFNHESPGHANLYIDQKWPGGKEHYIADNWKIFRERYNRRIDNFRNYMISNKLITFIITYPGSTIELENAIRKTYPNTRFQIKKIQIQNAEHYKLHMELMGVIVE